MIWILENETNLAKAWSVKLMNAFAVRRFENIASFVAACHAKDEFQGVLIIAGWCRDSLRAASTEAALDLLSQRVKGVIQISADGPNETIPESWISFPTGGGVEDLKRWVQALLMKDKCKTRESSQLKYRDLVLFLESSELQILPDTSMRSLTPKEVRMLTTLLSRPGACVSREDLTAKVWGDVRIARSTVDSHVSRLRRRLDGSEVALESIYGGGYILR